MAAIDQIIKWAQGLPAWQADAVRRLLEQGNLSTEDRNEIYQMLKVEGGIETECIKPEFPKVGGFSGTGETPNAIALQRILNIQHVNAVENGSTIPFGHQGITVIYGENGSGKSSYARILKRACRARDTKEPIHPNVFDEKEKGPATAVIKITDGDTSDIELPWTDGEPADERLARVTFFDSKCAQVIVDDNNEAVYIPDGCQVFDSLGEFVKATRARLQNDKPEPKEPSNPSIVVGTKADIFMKQLSRITKEDEIAVAVKWTSDDDKNLDKVLARIAQSKTKETIKKAHRLKSISVRAGELAILIRNTIKALSSETTNKLNSQLESIKQAEKALKLVAKADLQVEPLPAGSSNEWRLLYEAAREYSTKVAYPGREFPLNGPDDLCVLCQQDLSEEAQQRMRRFKKFMEDRSEQVFQAARKTLDESERVLRDLNPPRGEDYGNVLDELAADEKKEVEQTLVLLGAERNRFLKVVTSGELLKEAVQLKNHNITLTKLKTTLETAAEQAEKDADPVALKQLEESCDDLLSRKSLSQIQADVRSYVDIKQLEYKYERCIDAISTRSISEKSKAIISAALSPQLKGDLKNELHKFGADHLPLSVNITGREGGARHQLTFQSAARAKLSDVLSEGEHRVVALAGFLAELGGAPVNAPIVLDDPVSSLDHRYSRRIAERLVEEAKHRQTIVFTHNIAFLVEVEKLCGGIGLLVQTIKRSGAVPGKCMEGVPWEAMDVKKRLSYLDDQVNSIAELHSVDDSAYNKETAYIYDLLREAWEAFIERNLLSETVKRHDTDIQTTRLMQVEIRDEDCKRIHDGMSKCSTWMAGHDKSQALNVNRPSPSEVREDIQELRSFVKTINVRHVEVKKRRKSFLEPQTPNLG